MGIKIEDDILEFLAKNMSRNVRRMEGALTRVAGYVGLTRKKADLEIVQRLLRDILRERKFEPNHNRVYSKKGCRLLPFENGRHALQAQTRKYCISKTGSDVPFSYFD